jgi:prepilin-type N-terminal cleavage/methylation domain-containing protein/prepilin-type processing-associated H-X9-DG protein
VSPRHGFTLIELLVVVAVIALLVGILLPALGSARRSAHTIACLNNMRQLAIAQLAYANAHDGQLVDYGLSHGGSTLNSDLSWVVALQPFYEELVVERDPAASPEDQPATPEVLRSPADDSRHWSAVDGGPGEPVPGSGGRFRATSYGLNEHVTPTWAQTAPPFLQPANFDRIHLIRRPATTVQWLMMASEGPFAGSDHVHSINWWVGDFAPDAPPSIAATMVQIDAHGGERTSSDGNGNVNFASWQARSNYAFLDGHAETLRFEGVYSGPQRNSFDPRFPQR